MDVAAAIDRLEANAESLRRMLGSVSGDQARWRPQAGKWSMLEVAVHLVDEEREDFRARLGQLLEDPEAPWPPIDPQGWVASRAYSKRDLGETLAAFAAERASSVAWLRSLHEVDWEAEYRHPQLGALRAGDLLASWVAHDVLHLRQLAALEWGWCRRLTEPFSPAYAGDW